MVFDKSSPQPNIVIDVICKGLVCRVVGGAMKRELMKRKETELGGVLVELYTRCSPLGAA